MTKPSLMATFENSIDPELLSALKERPNVTHDKPTLIEIQERFESYFEGSNVTPAHSADISISNHEVPQTTTSNGLRVRCYRPVVAHNKPLPALLWIHGGGFIFGAVESDDLICERFAADCQCVVVSVEYRLAPQSPYPEGFNDCYEALLWLASTGISKLNIDANNIAVGGSSAGGCLAAGITLKAAETNGPKIKHQLLLIPALDDRHETLSSQQITDYRVVWNREVSLLAWGGYLQNILGETPPYAAPARITKIPNLPRTFISVEEQDLLRDEAIIYAQRLMQAGIATELHVYPGTYHGSFLEVPEAGVSKQHMSDVINSLQKAFTDVNNEQHIRRPRMKKKSTPVL